MRLDDLIAAPITGSGRAAVCVVRVSGVGAWAALTQIFKPFPAATESHRAYYGRVGDLDDGLVTFFEKGRSYTGQESAEISIHGSPASVRRLLDLLVEAGARLAEPGEFTWRAFANGRIDLSQAESVRDTVDAETAEQLRLAHSQREGMLRREVESLRAEVSRMLGEVEAHVDFSEEIGEPDETIWLSRLSELKSRIESLLRTAESGRILRQGLRIVILGRPNAGKSSLLNALLGSDRAIVSPTPGTTRDYIEERADLGGVPCVLIDTAGLRTSADAIETEGVKRARQLVVSADRLWYLFDSSSGWTEEDTQEVAVLPADKLLIVAAKSDLLESERGVRVSSSTRNGLDNLVEDARRFAPNAGGFAVSPRHAQALERALASLGLAEACVRESLPYDLLSTSLRETGHELGTITGESASADMIEQIFAEFCIGK